MKRFTGTEPAAMVLAALALLTSAITGCKTAFETERLRVFTVVAVNGDARYQTADSDKWHVIKMREHIPSGSLITTGPEVGNYLDIADGKISFVGNSHSKVSIPNNLTIYENSVLKLAKVTVKWVGGKKIEDTRLRLLKGSVLGYMGTTVPRKQEEETIGRQPEQPHYEIGGSNTVAHLQRARYFFSASGKTVVFSGAATLEFTDSGGTKDVPGQHSYDPATGIVSELDYSVPYYQFQILGSPCPILLPAEKPPLVVVPRRPF